MAVGLAHTNLQRFNGFSVVKSQGHHAVNGRLVLGFVQIQYVIEHCVRHDSGTGHDYSFVDLDYSLHDRSDLKTGIATVVTLQDVGP